MSRKEYSTCLHARGYTEGSGKGRTYNCRVCREHYCLEDKKPCPFYRSRYTYRMEWVQGAGWDNIQVPVPRIGCEEITYEGLRSNKKTAH